MQHHSLHGLVVRKALSELANLGPVHTRPSNFDQTLWWLSLTSPKELCYPEAMSVIDQTVKLLTLRYVWAQALLDTWILNSVLESTAN